MPEAGPSSSALFNMEAGRGGGEVVHLQTLVFREALTRLVSGSLLMG